MKFDANELKRRGEDLLQAAARNLLEKNPEHKTELQFVLEELLSTHHGPVKRMVSEAHAPRGRVIRCAIFISLFLIKSSSRQTLAVFISLHPDDAADQKVRPQRNL